MIDNGINKASRLPAYVQMADMLRSKISDGDYQPDVRLPPESILAKNYGVSVMTARQALGVLQEEGLVSRVQGKGTFVKKIGVLESNFDLGCLIDVFSDRKNLSVRIVHTGVKKLVGQEKDILGIDPKQPVIVVERIISHHNQPFTIHSSYTNFDPKSPTIESMLDSVGLNEIIFEEGGSNFKRGILKLLPTVLNEREAWLLNLKEGESVFKLEHLFYDFNNSPAAFGWFTISPEKMPLISKIGIWND